MKDAGDEQDISQYSTLCHRWQAWVLHPNHGLRSSVHSLWYVRGRGEAVRARLPADGCVSIGFNLGDPTRVWSRSGRQAQPKRLDTFWIEGLQRGYLDTATDKQTEMIGCRLTLAGALKLFGGELPQLSNSVVQDSNINKLPFRVLLSLLHETPGVTARLRILDRFLGDQFGRRPEPDPRMLHALYRLSSATGGRSVSDAADAVGFSRSRFTHWFRQQIGITPKQYASIHRFRLACADIGSGDSVDWCDLAVRHGYCDQSHLIREFNARLGMTPGNYHRRLDNLSQSVAMLDGDPSRT